MRAAQFARGTGAFGNLLVCPQCKENLAQKLRQGVAPQAASEYAGFWIRFVAWIIDAVILTVAGNILAVILMSPFFPSFRFPLGQPGTTPDEALAAMAPMIGAIGLASMINFVIECCYEGFFLSKYAATPGKMAFSLKVLRPDGRTLTFWRGFGRRAAKYVSGLILLIGYIMAGFDSQKRALHDRICDTRVIRVRS